MSEENSLIDRELAETKAAGDVLSDSNAHSPAKGSANPLSEDEGNEGGQNNNKQQEGTPKQDHRDDGGDDEENENDEDNDMHNEEREEGEEQEDSPEGNTRGPNSVSFPDDGILVTDVKNIILQVLSPYFDDDGGNESSAMAVVTGTPTAPSGMNNNNNNNNNHTNAANVNAVTAAAAEDTSPRYDHQQAKAWIQLITDSLMERLLLLRKPYKFVVHIVIMRKCGAGLHICSSCFYGQEDGWVGHSHDLSPHLYAVVTVYWCAI